MTPFPDEKILMRSLVLIGKVLSMFSNTSAVLHVLRTVSKCQPRWDRMAERGRCVLENF